MEFMGTGQVFTGLQIDGLKDHNEMGRIIFKSRQNDKRASNGTSTNNKFWALTQAQEEDNCLENISPNQFVANKCYSEGNKISIR